MINVYSLTFLNKLLNNVNENASRLSLLCFVSEIQHNHLLLIILYLLYAN
jgi:hypothetical protein